MEQSTQIVRIVDRTEQAEGVISLTLAALDGTELPAWEPGAHIDVFTGAGLTRNYSLCSSPADLTHYRVGVLREPDSRGGSKWVFENAHVGTELQISHPRNNFPLRAASGYRFVAGGIGITPILPMIAQAEAQGTPWSLLYGGRTRGSMGFLGELEQYGSKVTVAPQDEVGLLNLADRFSRPASDELLYACGPEPMLAAADAAKTAAGWGDDALHVERFVPKVIEAGEDETFEVEFVDSGITATVPEGLTVLDVAEQNGIDVLSSCREGTCGTCETPVIEGQVDHRDSLLTPAEQAAGNTMLICVSRAASGCRLLRVGL